MLLDETTSARPTAAFVALKRVRDTTTRFFVPLWSGCHAHESPLIGALQGLVAGLRSTGLASSTTMAMDASQFYSVMRSLLTFSSLGKAIALLFAVWLFVDFREWLSLGA